MLLVRPALHCCAYFWLIHGAFHYATPICPEVIVIHRRMQEQEEKDQTMNSETFAMHVFFSFF